MRRYFSVALVLLLLTVPSQAQTAEARNLVPEDALGFILIKDLRQLSDTVDRLARKLNVEERVSLLELIQKEMGLREGINERGSVVFIVLKGKEHKTGPGVVVALPAADHDK